MILNMENLSRYQTRLEALMNIEKPVKFGSVNMIISPKNVEGLM